MLRKLICISLFAFIALPVYSAPEFKDYPVKVYTGKKQPLKLTKENKSYRTKFKTLSSSNSKINFAGHYVVDFFGCGGGCASGLIYNAQTGKGDFLPMGALTGCYTDDGYMDHEVEYKPDSRLFVTFGMIDHADDKECATRYYLEENGKVKLIYKEPYKK